MLNGKRFILLALSSSVLLSNQNVHGFVVVNHHGHSAGSSSVRPTTTRPASWLAAKVGGSKKKNSKSKAGNSGGGFGVNSKTPDKNTQVRSVSGHTGSGTKPLRTAANTFDQLQKEFGAESVNDIYVRSVLNDPETFWFVGKTARALSTSDDMVVPTPVMAVISQKRLILEYAIHQLRPQNLGGKFASSLELWIAPGNSEMDVVQNKIALEKVEGSVTDLLPVTGFHISTVGFNPEIYVGEEVQKGGLRVKRNDRGEPLKEVFEVNLSA